MNASWNIFKDTLQYKKSAFKQLTEKNKSVPEVYVEPS